MAEPAVRKTLSERIGPVSNWLPGLAAFLCLCMFAAAAMVLVDSNSEPKSPSSANMTSVSAQGFQGLKRLLDARGHEVRFNRSKAVTQAEHGDIEIITWDAGNGFLSGLVEQANQSASSTSDDSTSSTDKSESADASASASTQPVDPNDPTALDGSFSPNAVQAQHILYDPFGRVVLIVAPKWQAGYARTNGRWASDARLAAITQVRDFLSEISPETEMPKRTDKDGKMIPPPVLPGQAVWEGDDTATVYEKAPYIITRNARPVTKKPGATLPIALMQTMEPIAANLTLTPVAGQLRLTGPIAAGQVRGLQSISGPNLQPVLLGPNGEVLLSRVVVTRGRQPSKAPVYLLSDPDLLDNQILADPQKVIAALALIDGIAPPAKGKPSIVFNLVFNGMAYEHDIFHALSRPPFIAVPLCLLIAGLGLMWAAFSRFGPPRLAEAGPSLGRGVQVLADNAARLVGVAFKETKLGPAYADVVRDSVLKTRGYRAIATADSPDDLAERIGRLHGTTDSFTDLKARAGRVLTVHQLIDITLRLHAWKTEIERAHI